MVCRQLCKPWQGLYEPGSKGYGTLLLVWPTEDYANRTTVLGCLFGY